MTDTAFVQLSDHKTQFRFDWLEFDGKDSFAEFRITGTAAGRSTVFDFGRCAASGFRRLTRLLGDPAKTSIHGDFRYSDSHIRYFYLFRESGGYRLSIGLKAIEWLSQRSEPPEEYRVERASVVISQEFLNHLTKLRPLNNRCPEIADILDRYEAHLSTLHECFRPIIWNLERNCVGEVLKAFPAELTQMYKDWVEAMPVTEEQWSEHKELLLGVLPARPLAAEDLKKWEEAEKLRSRRAVEILREYFGKNPS